MPVDDFAFDAYDRLVGRQSMAGSPVSVLIRNPAVDQCDEIIDRCQTLLSGRRLPDEVILLVAEEPARRPPAMIGRISVRTVVHDGAGQKEGMEWLLANARWPVAVFAGPEAELPAETFRAMLDALDHADVVVGRRPGGRGRWNPLSWFIRRLFGVSLRDPLTPYLAVRRQTVAGMPLELNEPMTPFELLAKSTFAFAIYDELEVVGVSAPAEPFHRTASAHWRALAGLFRRPRFWGNSSEGPLRLAPQETGPPGIAERSRWDQRRGARQLFLQSEFPFVRRGLDRLTARTR